MPLEAYEPKLDSRTYDQLRDEALRQVQRFVPEWTDFNESDPGKALLELFAWFTDQMLYALNKTPELNYLKFLKLLDMEPTPARPAVAHLTFTAREGVIQATVPIRTRIEADTQSEQPVIFETDQAFDLIVPPLAQVQVYDGAVFQVVTPYNEPHTPAFLPFGYAAQPNSALYLGFTPPQNPPADGSNQFPPLMRFRIFLSEVSGNLTIGANEQPISSVRMVWEARNPESRRWRELDVVLDETAGFTREGYIVVAGPQHVIATPEGNLNDDALYWLRCRLVSGTYPPDGVPQVDFIRPNTVEAHSLETVQDEIVAESDGMPDHTYPLRRRPVWVSAADGEPALPHIVTLDADDAEIEWIRVDDLLASTRNDRHYVLNATTGAITFGDGTYGMIPPAGVSIVARTYRYGGGTAANVAPDKIAGLMDSVPGVDAVTNLRKSEGGSDEQSLDKLRRQAPARLRHRERAVTLEDYQALACEVGGVAQAQALGEWHPDYRDELRVPGAITVIIVPNTGANPPEASHDLLDAVERHLDERRMITTELYVARPHYRPLSAEMRVAINPQAAPNQVKEDILKALNESKYLNPATESFGQSFYPTNLYNVLLDVKNVTAVRSLSVSIDHTPQEPITKLVNLALDELIYLADYRIEVELDA